MPPRLTCSALLLLTIVQPIGLAIPAAAQSPAKSYLYQKRLARQCPPPLKYAAGACVRHCPAGYEDHGRYCRFRSMRGRGGR
ncbi:hypothetical protein QW694_23885 [Methylobacterium isbiliense]|nr:hypothetical protein [Methylobacterium isbiliense]MDN3626059.1 hypothetical protein [Methylobacterium isbiliense]